MFRFSIRDVLWLTVVVGLALGWWADRSSVLTAYHQSVRFGMGCCREIGRLEAEIKKLRDSSVAPNP